MYRSAAIHSTTATNSSDVIVFCYVAKTQSFSKAAKLLGISRSLVSKRVTRLEDRLETRLIQRSTRSMSLTEAGDLLYRRYTDISDRIERAEREVADLNRTHSGVIRFAAPSLLSYVGMALISKLHRRFPNIEVQLAVDDGDIDIIESGYDAAIQVGRLKDSNLICRKITSTRLAVVASPRYLSARGFPARPKDLRRHNCLALTPESGEDKHWHFAEEGKKAFALGVDGDFQTNNEVTLMRACLAGMGLAQLPTLLADEHVRTGRLELVLETYSHVSTEVYVVLPHRDTSEKVRVALDFLAEQVRENFNP